MFCPPEYVHIHEILDTCKRAAAKLPENDLSTALSSSTSANPITSVHSYNLRKAVEQQMVKICLEEYRHAASAYAPPDKILRLSSKVVTLAKPAIHILKSDDPRPRVELFYIDVRTGRIDLANLANRISSWAAWRLKGETFANFHSCNMDIQRKALSEFGEIDGWIVCFERSAMTGREKDVKKLWRKALSSDRSMQADLQGNKQNSLEQVWQDISQAFPHGKTATWADIERISGHSRRNIKRALDQYNGHESWAGRGQDVGNND